MKKHTSSVSNMLTILFSYMSIVTMVSDLQTQ